MAEHWMYLPMAGLLWALAELLVPISKSAWLRPPVAAAAVVAAIWIVALLAITVVRNNDWRDNESIYVETLRYNPDSIRVQYNLAVTYSGLQNDLAAKRHFEEVLRIYQERKERSPQDADRLWDDELESHLSLGDIYREQGDYKQAAEHYYVVATLIPDPSRPDYAPLIATANYGLGHAFLAVGQIPRALEFFNKVPEGRPDLLPEIRRITANYSSQAPA
jgi:tetratricopeptide (TPR) repeat protein